MGNRVDRIEFTKEMKEEYTILAPNMLPVHFSLIEGIFKAYGYKTVVIKNEGQDVIDAGLKYVHNDTCYPALLIIGQMIAALNSGSYDTSKTALLVAQTGGGCRASNYIHLLRKALIKAGYPNIPVISLNLSGLEKNSGFKLTMPMIRQLIVSIAYGDLLMLLKNQVKPYEINQGEADALVQTWVKKLLLQYKIKHGLSLKEMEENLIDIIQDFKSIKVLKTNKVKVGIVGEIYVKFSSLGNNNLEEFLYEQGCECMVPGMVAFLLFKIDNRLEENGLYGGSKIKYMIAKKLYDYFTKIETILIQSVKEHSEFTAPNAYREAKKLIDGMLGFGNKMGEGWLLPAEMLELCDHEYHNIVCAQPFGCLPNHIVGRGMIRSIKSRYPSANITAIDYDPGATKVNQENRIKLMLAVAKDELEKKNTMAKKQDYKMDEKAV